MEIQMNFFVQYTSTTSLAVTIIRVSTENLQNIQPYKSEKNVILLYTYDSMSASVCLLPVVIPGS